MFKEKDADELASVLKSAIAHGDDEEDLLNMQRRVEEDHSLTKLVSKTIQLYSTE